MKYEAVRKRWFRMRDTDHGWGIDPVGLRGWAVTIGLLLVGLGGFAGSFAWGQGSLASAVAGIVIFFGAIFTLVFLGVRDVKGD